MPGARAVHQSSRLQGILSRGCKSIFSGETPYTSLNRCGSFTPKFEMQCNMNLETSLNEIKWHLASHTFKSVFGMIWRPFAKSFWWMSIERWGYALQEAPTTGALLWISHCEQIDRARWERKTEYLGCFRNRSFLCAWLELNNINFDLQLSSNLMLRNGIWIQVYIYKRLVDESMLHI